MKNLSPIEKKQKDIALKTLKMNNPMMGMMGGMNKEQAVSFLKNIGYTDQQIQNLKNWRSAMLDMSKLATAIDTLSKIAKSLKQRKTDFILNMNTDDMGTKEYNKTKAKVNKMTEDEFDTMFKSMGKRGDLK